MEKYLKETKILDFSHPNINELIESKKWESLSEYEKIGSIYHFVQNDIAFGYNVSDEIPASSVLSDGYGQCNTKGTLLMALLRRVGIPCRFHGFTIDKKLQKGAITGLPYLLAPKNIIHSWVEVYYQEQWINLEGFILDKEYLNSLQCAFPEIKGSFCGYGVATSNFKNPQIDWKGSDTYIQKEGINNDFGVFNDPDSFYKSHGSNLGGLKAVLYKHVVRKLMNSNVSKIRLRKNP
ncbi:MAG TPA: transglutaminase family protein [Oceanospirillales bacterium]|nr:transglutaminase family protein [Oceanospirillales bacterium]